MSDLPWAVQDMLQHGAYVFLFLLALVRGAMPERILAGLIVVTWLLHNLYHALLGSLVVHGADIGHMAIDFALLLGIFGVALRANRVYPLWLGGAQIIAVMAHLYRLSLSEINRFAYDTMSIVPSYIQLLALALGLVFHMVRRKRLGNYPSWRGTFVAASPLFGRR